ncbi:MAG: hypothetical protein WCO83_02500 [Alphaproteobacteria bacterium]
MAGKKPGPRPKLTADDRTLGVLRGAGQIMATTKDCAALLSVSEPTFFKFLADNPEAREAFEQGKGHGRIGLRRTQFRLAEKSAAMAQWLGKQYLDQRDKLDHEVTGANGGPIQYVDLTGVSDAELERLDALLGGLLLADQAPDGGLEDPDSGGDHSAED